MLLPNYDMMTNTDMTDAQAFGFGGWQVGSNPMRRGYYDPMRPHNADWTDSFLATKMEWINDHAPGTTVFNSWFPGSAQNDRKPTIADLAAEIGHGEDVEFFVRGDGGFYHAMTLSGVMCDMAMNCSIKYQDPNNPTTEYMAAITDMGGMLTFMNVPGSGFTGQVTITAAFAESPIPEPAAFVMIVMALSASLASYRRRSR